MIWLLDIAARLEPMPFRVLGVDFDMLARPSA